MEGCEGCRGRRWRKKGGGIPRRRERGEGRKGGDDKCTKKNVRYQASLPLYGFLLLSFFDFIPFFGLHSCVSYVSFHLSKFVLQQLAVGNSQLVGTSIYFVPLSPVPADRICRWFMNFIFFPLPLPMKAFSSSRSTQSCPCPPRFRAIFILLHKAACFVFSLVARPASCSLPPTWTSCVPITFQASHRL